MTIHITICADDWENDAFLVLNVLHCHIADGLDVLFALICVDSSNQSWEVHKRKRRHVWPAYVDAENILRELVIGMVFGINPHNMSRVIDQILQSCFVFDCPSKFP